MCCGHGNMPWPSEGRGEGSWLEASDYSELAASGSLANSHFSFDILMQANAQQQLVTGQLQIVTQRGFLT